MPLLKIGDTTRDVTLRVTEQDGTANPEELIILHNESANFRDYEVHKFLERPDVNAIRERSNREWFRCSLDTVKSSINKLKTGSFRPLTFQMRDEQSEAVDLTYLYFNTTIDEQKRFLWNAKMRFGKTFSAYQLMKKSNYSKVLVLTYKPSTWHNWKSDLNDHIDFEEYTFIRAIEYSCDCPINLDFYTKCVTFCSFQDLLQDFDSAACQIKDKFKYLLSYVFDLVIIDEVHFGASTDKAKDLLANIQCDKTLYLSGTPFKFMRSDEIGDDQIYSWSYIDEQIKRQEDLDRLGQEECEKFGQYYWLPQMTILGDKIPEPIINQVKSTPEFADNDLFTFTKFFNTTDDGLFTHPANIDELLNSIKPRMIFTCDKINYNIKHSLWVLPGVSECKAMYHKLISHSQFKQYKIIVAADDNMKEGYDSVKLVTDNIARIESGTTRYIGSITLSCGKLTTGVTIPEWNAVFMLNDISSPELYLQSIFRGQSSDKKSNKTQCVVLDFNPDRLLSVIYEYSKFNCANNISPRDNVQKLLSVINILCLDGIDFAKISDDDIFDVGNTGMSRSILAKKFSSKNLINVNMTNVNRLSIDCLKILDEIIVYRSRPKGTSIQLSECSLCGSNSSGGSNSTSAESKETKKILESIHDKLLKLSSTLPRFAYLSEYREESIYDIITCYEKNLFEKVCGISSDKMKILIDNNVFNMSRINECIFQFRRFEDFGDTPL